MFHFLIGVAHYNLTTEKWKKAPMTWMKAEGDRKITSEALLQSLLAKVRTELDRSAYKQWLAPTESGNWLLCYQLTQQGYPVIIETWEESLLLSEIIDTRPFDTKLSDGKKGPIIGVWLCFQPDEPSDSGDCAPTPTPKEPQKKGKAGTDIKRETKKETKKEIKKEGVDKRPRSASSAEINRPAKRLPVRQGNAATQGRAMEQVEEEDLLHTSDDVEDELPPLEQLTGRK